MTEEEFFINNYPDSCYGDKPLSPHWDFFQDGVEFGERKSEQRITELEAQIERNKIDLAISEHDREHDDYELTEVYEKVKQLEKENADLKCECRRCVYSDTPCILSDYGKDRNGICDHFKDVFEELNNWKDEWQEQVQKATDEGYARTLQTMQLNKAKELLKKLVLEVKGYEEINGYDTCEPVQEAEQFISEVEK